MSNAPKQKFIFNHPFYYSFYNYMRKTIHEIHDEISNILERINDYIENKIDVGIIPLIENTFRKALDFLKEERKCSKSITSSGMSNLVHRDKNLEDLALLQKLVNELSTLNLTYITTDEFLDQLRYIRMTIIDRLERV